MRPISSEAQRDYQRGYEDGQRHIQFGTLLLGVGIGAFGVGFYWALARWIAWLIA